MLSIMLKLKLPVWRFTVFFLIKKNPFGIQPKISSGSELLLTPQNASSLRRIARTQDSLFLLGSKDSLFQVRELASVCDKIISLGNCVGNVTRLMTRNTFAAVNSVTN